MDNWIKVEDKLPEKGDSILIANKGNDWTIPFVGEGELISQQSGWMFCSTLGTSSSTGYLDFNDVSHWQPMPELPKSE